MARINVYSSDYERSTLEGWFESSKADFWSDRDWNGDGSQGTGRGQTIWRTAQGRWVLENWTRWQGESDSYRYIDADEAREWLLKNNRDDIVEKYLGEIEEETGPGGARDGAGRPEIGPAINIRLPQTLIDDIDAARREDESRAGAIRRLLIDAMNRSA